ncbi:MAG: methylenetetrahydrofolate reductase [NAD(P)H] [Opitutales bacterium]|nr:methylenetetrahydrofolate reductase [NAD(P)H] [Opitutales bacterium]
MNIARILASQQTCFSFEFFPPRTEEASQALFESMGRLCPLNPGFVSVTYGAGGGTRQLTHDLVVRLKKETGLTIVPHLTTVGHTRSEVESILDRYTQNGIGNLMALRGDPQKGLGSLPVVEDGFAHAGDLVSYVRSRYPDMGIGVAGFPEGHPECPNRMLEIDYLKAKVDAGADYICTQLFFDNRDFYDFCERCELAGIRVPILAGIMPITSLKGMKRMAELALGARFPAKLMRALSRATSEDGVQEIGLHWATEQVSDLLDHKVRGIHFYTLNRSDTTLRIYKSLGLGRENGKPC